MRSYYLEIEDFIKHGLEVVAFGEGKPEVLITGGIHGGEATGIYTAKKLIEYLKTKDLLKGSVKVLAVSNPTAFRRMERTSPYDGLDLNRIFPGSKRGTISQRVAAAIWEESQTADYIVDLHCCGVWGYSYTLALWKEFDYAKELAEMLDIPLIVESGGTRGQLFVETCHQGRPAVIIELPGGGQGGAIDIEAGDQCFNALVGMLAQLGMVAEEYRKPAPQLCNELVAVRVHEEGLFVPAVKAGDTVEEGQVIGTVAGNEIKSPCKGTFTGMRPASFVFPGSFIARIAPHVE